MSTVLVAIPVFKDGRRFHLEKGRRWTIVEHMLLEALAKADWTISDLTTASALPRRVVIEVVIRLMRAGWVELKIANGGVQFSTTPTGRLYATREDLPPVTRADVRYIGYIVELVTGSVFKIRDMTTLTEDQWKVRRSGREHAEVSAMLDMRSASPAIPVLAERLLDSDEQILRIDPKDFRPRRLFGLVTVRGKEIEGIGPNMPPALRRAILIAAGAPEADKGRSSGAAVGAGIATERAERETHTVTLRPDDFVFGGAKHRQALTDAIRLARHRIVLHSTFINEAQALEVVEQLKSAVLRGAIVDILWGQSVETAEGNRTRHAALALKAKLTADGLQDRIRVHMTTTRSHAKLVLSDTGDSDRFEALIGSCNWLSSDFLAFDVSLKLRDPGPVRELAWDLAELARPRDGQMPDLSVELFRLGRAVRAPDDVVGSRGTARVITATEHAALLAQARDQAQERITILSHRLGAAAKPALAILAAARERIETAEMNAIYGRLGDHISQPAVDDLTAWARGKRINLTPAPLKLHAKVLAWDRDKLLVTSQNLLSADPGDSAPRQELGVFVTGADAAARLTGALIKSKSKKAE